MLNIDDPADPQNFILAYHDGTKARLVKCVAGTYTSLIAENKTYGASKHIVAIKEGTSVSLFYGDSKAGNTQTVSDAGVKDNTKHTWWSTHPGNTFAHFAIWPRITPLPQGV